MKFLGFALLAWALVCSLDCAQAGAQAISSSSPISSVDDTVSQTTLGDLSADAIREAARADFAFVPASAVRQLTLPSAGLTAQQIANAFTATTAPSNCYVTMHVKGRQIVSALERSVSRLPEGFDGFLQVSGLTVIYDASLPLGSRIVSVALPGGQALDNDSQYIVAVTEPLGIGSMGYFQAWNKDDIDQTSDSAVSTVVSAYAVSHQPLTIDTANRLKSK